MIPHVPENDVQYVMEKDDEKKIYCVEAPHAGANCKINY